MKKENNNYIDVLRVNHINIFEIAILFYCLIFFKNYIPFDFHKIINYSINTNTINSYILYKNIENSEDTKLEKFNVNLNNSSKMMLLKNKKFYDFENEKLN